MGVVSAAGALAERVAAVDEWYHTQELAPGIVTPGFFDTRSVPDVVGFPESLGGRRCLDVGTFDGFWAFEMERRGASEVVAIDVLDPQGWDWPANSSDDVVAALGRRKLRGAGFEIAREALRSSVQRLEISVYDAGPEELGHFDFVYLGSLLMHLRDPVGALMRVRSLCHGGLLVVDNVNLGLALLTGGGAAATLDAKGRPWWWKPTPAALVRMVHSAGFRVEGRARRFRMPPGPGMLSPPLRPGALLRKAGREAFVRARLGDPHAAVHAFPA
jgi:tRNA (mo5U34)-methyltransferase